MGICLLSYINILQATTLYRSNSQYDAYKKYIDTVLSHQTTVKKEDDIQQAYSAKDYSQSDANYRIENYLNDKNISQKEKE